MFEKDEVSKKSEIITLLLCLLFGITGAHRFYVGRWKGGIVYLLLGSSIFYFLNFVDRVGSKGVLFTILAYLLLAVMIIYDIFAIYSNSFTDGKGKLLISNSEKDESFGRTPTEKFNDRLNIVICICVFIMFVGAYIALLNLKK